MRSIITPLAFLCCLPAFSQNIVLDPNFGNDGISYVENTTEITKIIRNPDGTIISSGPKATGSGNYHLALTKHNASGVQDLTFGTNGIAETTIAYSDMIYDIQLQSDGKILLSGTTYTGLDTGPGGTPVYNAFVVRYHPNGMIDSGFGTNGIFKVTNYNDSQFNSIIVQSDQSLLLVGNADNIVYFTKLTSAGALDTSFGTNGIRAISNFSTFSFFNQGAIRLADGSILSYGLDGTNFPNYAVSCIKTDSLGNVITSFGQNGITSFNFDPDPNQLEILSKAEELPDGKIVLAGNISNRKLIVKLKADGTLDSTFAVNGALLHTLPFIDMLVQPNGKIIIGGSTEISTGNYGISVSRFNSNGTIDNGFNGTGTFEADLSDRNDFLHCIVLIGSDHLLAGGSIRPIDVNSVFGLAQIDMSESLGFPINKSDELSIYPNPFSDKVTVSFGNEFATSIQLTDAMGRIVGNYPANQQTILDLKHLDAGIYQVIFTNNQQEKISQKLIKQ